MLEQTTVGDGLKQRIKQSRFESPAHEAMLNLLVAAGHIRQKTEAACAPHDLTAAQFNVLRILRGAYPEGYPRGEIALRMVERAPDVTRLTDRLERRGLVERTRTRTDRRLSITRITKAGLDLLRHVDPPIRAISREFSERLPARDQKELSRMCERIYADKL